MKSSSRVWVISVIASMIAHDSAGLSHNDTAEIIPSEPSHHQRSKRSLFFPYNAAQGLIAAIAIPLGVPDRNIFMSYNFEGNYNDPTQSNVFTEGLFNFIIGDLGLPLTSPLLQIHRSLDENPAVIDKSATTAQIEDEITTTDPTMISPSSHPIQPAGDLLKTLFRRSATFTRKKAYRAIESHIKRTGLDGKKCLLRAICEASEIPLGENNGVVGDIIHILLSPSTSVDEGLPPEFYKAERLGREGRCQKYRKHCDENVLDHISFLL
ncbi:uncharacterized protein LOC134217989 [Armigeres subalbatus]|uniref:uncharacterized protein LOC134217989 n=1 Tax=Armigeres subalbatus TaxID=124917 RepID=UPI002ED2BAAB